MRTCEICGLSALTNYEEIELKEWGSHLLCNELGGDAREKVNAWRDELIKLVEDLPEESEEEIEKANYSRTVHDEL